MPEAHQQFRQGWYSLATFTRAITAQVADLRQRRIVGQVKRERILLRWFLVLLGFVVLHFDPLVKPTRPYVARPVAIRRKRTIRQLRSAELG